MIPILIKRHFRIRSDWSRFHLELVKLMNVFNNNGNPQNFINNCFKIFLDDKRKIEEKLEICLKKL